MFPDFVFMVTKRRESDKPLPNGKLNRDQGPNEQCLRLTVRWDLVPLIVCCRHSTVLVLSTLLKGRAIYFDGSISMLLHNLQNSFNKRRLYSRHWTFMIKYYYRIGTSDRRNEFN